MALQHCSSESRAFFIIENLSPGAAVWTKKALSQLGSTLSVTLKQPCPVGVAVLQRKAGQAAQLQILLRLGCTFQAHEYLSCIKRLPTRGDAAASDGFMLSSALAALMQHMQKLPARPNCHNHLFVLSSSFEACADNPKMQKLLQVVSQQPSYSLHFMQLSGPEAELQATAAAASETGAGGQGALFVSMLRAAPSWANITFSAFVADCEAVADLMCKSWLRELLTHSHSGSNSSSGPAALTPDLLLHFGGQTLPCSIQQHILQLDAWAMPAHLCPCHHNPMQAYCNSSHIAAAHAAAAAAASDAGSMAALLLLPEAAPWSCSITGQSVAAPLSSCAHDARILQLGRHTQLTMAPAAAASLAASKPPGQASSGHLSDSSRLRVMQALPLQAGQSCELTVQHLTPPSAVDSMLLYGMPLLLTPTAAASCTAGGSTGAIQRDAMTAGLGPRDQGVMGPSVTGTTHQQQAPAMTASESGMLMRALCQLLLEQQQVLLASSNTDLLRRIHLPLQQWYMLQPAADGSSLLLRWVAAREQLLPPRRWEGDPLTAGSSSSSAGGAAATGTMCMQEEPEEVVLLDAEQLEAVRASLASLKGPGGCAGSNGSNGCSQPPGDADGRLVVADTAVGDCDADAASAAPSCDQLHKPQPAQPLLLSCGLDAWVSAVFEASTATYTPPTAAPLITTAAAAAAAAAAAGAAGIAMGHLAHSALAGGQAPMTAHALQHQQALPPPMQHGLAVPPHQQQGLGHVGPSAVGQAHVGHFVGQHTLQAGAAAVHVAGTMQPAGAAAAAAGDHAGQHQQQQQQGLTEGASGVVDATTGGRGGAGGRGGRGRRNSSTGAGAGTGRKLRLSKV